MAKYRWIGPCTGRKGKLLRTNKIFDTKDFPTLDLEWAVETGRAEPTEKAEEKDDTNSNPIPTVNPGGVSKKKGRK